MIAKLTETVKNPVADKTEEIRNIFGIKTYSENVDLINSSFRNNPTLAGKTENIRNKVLDSFSLPGYFRLLFFRKD